MNGNNTRVYLNQGRIKGRILSRARKKKDVIFGGKSIQKQIGLGARPTEDFDIFTKKSKKSAVEMEKKFDKITRGDNYFTKKGKHPSTWKIKWRGKDLVKDTRDDKTIVDYTKTPKPEPKSVKISGIKYRTLDLELAAKRRAIKDPKFKFRKEKDLGDVRRILKARKSFRKY